MDEVKIRWTEYMKYRVLLRRFDLAKVEHILRYSSERYLDTATGRRVAVGRHRRHLVLIPYEQEATTMTPVTIHVTSRRQIDFRVKSGRFKNA